MQQPLNLPPNAADDVITGELRQAIQRRMLDFTLPLDEALERAGLEYGLPAARWARWNWYGPVEQVLADEGRGVSDILVNAPGRALTLVVDGLRRPSDIRLHPEWVMFVQRQLLLRGRVVAPESLDAWPAHQVVGAVDRLRFAVTRPPLSPFGPTVALRILPERWRNCDQLVQAEILTAEVSELLLEALRRGVTILVAGGTGSGKTTLTAALLQAIGVERRVVIVEEAGELPELPDSLHMEVTRSGVSFAQAVYLTLRQKPDLTVVGEVRGPEAASMLRAAATGHPGVATIHAGSVPLALANLARMAAEDSEMPVEVVRALLNGMMIPLLVVHIGRYGGRRCVGAVVELAKQAAATDLSAPFKLNPLFEYDSRSNDCVRCGQVAGDWGRGVF